MTEHHDTYHVIDSQQAWDHLLPRLQRAEALAVDIEGNGFHRYPEQICLIQLADERESFVLDPFGISDLSGLGALLGDPAIVKIFHCCEYDVRSLIRDFGFYTRNIFDTSVAAHFLGANQLGLAATLKNFLGIEIPKSKSLQRQDWTLRPLSEEALWYAAGDVYFLPRMRQRLQADLESKGRWAWVQEEFEMLEKLEYSPPEPVEEMFWRIKGSRLLKPKQRAILRELCCFRDVWAREANRPPFRMVPNETLLAIAQDPDADLSKIKGISHVIRQGKLHALTEAVNRGKHSEGITLPKTAGRRNSERDPEAGKRLEALKAWRNAKGVAMALDPSLLWPMIAMQALAGRPEMIRDRAGFDPELGVRQWQWELFGEELVDLLSRAPVDPSLATAG